LPRPVPALHVAVRLKTAMSSFARRSLRPAWSIEDHALFAARKEFELLKLLSTDKKALAMARRLGALQLQSHPSAVAAGGRVAAGASGTAASAHAARPRNPHVPDRQQGAARCAQQFHGGRAPRQSHSQPQHPTTASAAGGAVATAPVVGAPTGSDTLRTTSKRRRSARRSARRHVRRAQPIRSAALALLFTRRLHRRVRLRRDLVDLGELACDGASDRVPLPDAAAVKRGRPASRAGSSDLSSSESSGDPLEYEHHHVLGLARTFGHARAPPTKRGGEGAWRPGFLLR